MNYNRGPGFSLFATRVFFKFMSMLVFLKFNFLPSHAKNNNSHFLLKNVPLPSGAAELGGLSGAEDVDFTTYLTF